MWFEAPHWCFSGLNSAILRLELEIRHTTLKKYSKMSFRSGIGFWTEANPKHEIDHFGVQNDEILLARPPLLSGDW